MLANDLVGDKVDAAKMLLLDLQSWQEEYDCDSLAMLGMLVFFVGTSAKGLQLTDAQLSEAVADVTPTMIVAALSLADEEIDEGGCGVADCDSCGESTPSEDWRNAK